MQLDSGYMEQGKGFAMLIDAGTMALILSDRQGCSSREWKGVAGKRRRKDDEMRGDYRRRGKEWKWVEKR